MKILNIFKKQKAAKSAKIEKVSTNQLNKINGGAGHEVKSPRDPQQGIPTGNIIDASANPGEPIGGIVVKGG